MKTMKALVVIIALAVILLMAYQARSQDPFDAKVIIQTVVKELQSKSIHSRAVKWDSIRALMNKSAEEAKSVADCRRAFEIALLAMQDEDGSFVDPTSHISIAGPLKNANPEISEVAEPANSSNEFIFKMLRHNIRYLRLPAFAEGGDIQAQAQMLRHTIDSLSKGEELHWIIDLRYAAGGAINPLMAGMAPLLDEGLAAARADYRENVMQMYTVHNGNFYVDQVPVVRFPILQSDLRSSRIAVLTSRHTSGAAEMLAIALKARKNTRFFGEPTGGDIYGMTTVKISEHLAMQFQQSMFIDRRGHAYRSAIEPDTFVEFEPVHAMRHHEDDKAVAEASTWLRSVVDAQVKLGMN